MPLGSDGRTHFHDDGSGPALLLLHGTGGDGWSHWAPLLPTLTPHRRVICPDLPGSGRTPAPTGPLQLDDLVAAVLASADACGQARFDLAGYSLGAVVAAAVAARHPARVRRLLLIAGFASTEDSRSQLQFQLWQALIAQDTDLMARLVLLTGLSAGALASLPAAVLEKRVQAIVKHTDWTGMSQQAELDARIDIRAELGAIQAPTRLIVGSEDQMVPLAASQALQAGIPQADCVSLPSGHLITLEQPQALAEAMLEFTGG